MIVVTEICDCWAAIFFVYPAILRRLVSSMSQKESSAGPSASASSEYRQDVFRATVVRKEASCITFSYEKYVLANRTPTVFNVHCIKPSLRPAKNALWYRKWTS